MDWLFILLILLIIGFGLACAMILFKFNQAVIGKNAYKIQYDHTLNELHDLKEKHTTLNREYQQTHANLIAKNQAFDDLIAYNKQAEAKQKSDRDLFLQQAKQSVMEAGQILSSKLLHDHREENKQSRREAEERVQKVTQSMLEKLQDLDRNVAGFQQTKETVQLLERALASPGMAGQASQTALGNMLSHIGLIEGRDYFLEYSLTNQEGQRLRPDAVVFLPGGAVFVIDSKSSKFLLDLAETELNAPERYEETAKQFLKSMHQHIKDLKARDYAVNLEEALRKHADFQGNKPALMVSTLMWLPYEGALERLEQIDAQFVARAASDRIYPVATNGLWAALGVAQCAVQFQQREENLQHIADNVKDMLAQLGPMLGHAAKLGKSLRSSIMDYDRFAGSVNKHFISSSRRLVDMGIPKPTKGLPDKLPKIGGDVNQITIEQETLEIEEKPATQAIETQKNA